MPDAWDPRPFQASTRGGDSPMPPRPDPCPMTYPHATLGALIDRVIRRLLARLR